MNKKVTVLFLFCALALGAFGLLVHGRVSPVIVVVLGAVAGGLTAS